MTAKYGLPLTGSDWAGLPLRCGQFESAGELEELLSPCDSVLTWSGTTRVVLEEVVASGQLVQRDFVRHSGMIDLLPANTRIRRLSWTGEAAECVSVMLPEETKRELAGARAGAFSLAPGCRFGLSDPHVLDVVYRLRSEVDSHRPLSSSYVQGLSLALCAYVGRSYGATTSEPEFKRGLSWEHRRRLADFVEERLGGDVGLVDLARLTGYSPDHFARLFKSAFEMTPHRYLVTRRLERAKCLLLDPRRSIAAVAMSCGFSSQAHLNRAFKQHTGITPGEFRK